MEKERLRHELLHAYFQARRHKRGTINQLRFEIDLENNLRQLECDLINRTYELMPAVCFINTEPVKREVIAADFRDRVVHHLLFNWINPIFERQLIYDCYSCRKGKGTLFGIERAYHYMQSESDNFRRECYVMRLDISGFFMNIDRDVLYEAVMKGLEHGCWAGVPDKELCVYLLQKFIYNDPLKGAFFRSPAEMWSDLPRNKSLRYTKENCGLPIGNLTSQLFGNVYLNRLDHFVKQNLRMHCYGRYVDDMYLIHRDSDALKSAAFAIELFLVNRYGLSLNNKKFYLQPLKNGFAFLGAFLKPGRIYPGRRIAKNAVRAFMHPRKDWWKNRERVVSYCGLLGHYNTFNLMNSVC